MNSLLDETTEDEMYAIEFSPEELCEGPLSEEPEVSTTRPVCESEDLDFAYRYPAGDEDEGEGGEMYHCRACGSVGDAEECASIGPFPAAIGVRSETAPAVRECAAFLGCAGNQDAAMSRNTHQLTPAHAGDPRHRDPRSV